MAEWSVVNRSVITQHERLDAEYFQPEYLRQEALLHLLPCVDLGELAFVTDGIHASPDAVEEGGVRYLSAKCVKDNDFSLAQTLQISSEQDAANRRTRIQEGDILLTTVGTIGNAAVVQSDLLPANIDRHLGLVRIHPSSPVDAYYVAAFLNSKFGRFQSLREATGNVQLNLFIEKIKTLQIPIMREANGVSERCKAAYSLRRKASGYFAEAESILTEALGIRDVAETNQLFYQRRFSELAAAERFDAEYFSSRFQQTLSILRADGQSISDVSALAERRFRPEFLNPDRVFEYIEIGSVRGDGLADSEPVEAGDAPSRAQWVVERGDIITSTVRPIRRLSAIVTPEQSGYVCSSGFAVLRPKEERIAPEVLLTYLRLPIICEILDLYTTASMYPAISTSKLMAVPIPIISKSVHGRVVAKVQAALMARKDATAQLEQAKAEIDKMVTQPIQ